MALVKFPEHTIYVGSSEDSAKLYAAEERATAAIKDAARELQVLMREGGAELDFRSEALPQVLSSFAERFGYVLAKDSE
jgi:hypothetical protein